MTTKAEGGALVLESRVQLDRTVRGRLRDTEIQIAPMVNGEYWAFRVRLSKKQAIVGFPKFSTIGIGFAKEEDWNTNLPYTEPTAEIYEHIKHNKGDPSIRKARCLRAIKMVQDAAAATQQPRAAPSNPAAVALSGRGDK